MVKIVSVVEELASSLGRNDEAPNQALAKTIATKGDNGAVNELINCLRLKNKAIQNDSIKVLYEIGRLNPMLISPFLEMFVTLLKHKNNRLQWGAMTAIDSITLEEPSTVFRYLPEILDSAKNGSVVTRDSAVNILIKLCSLPQYSHDAFSLLIEQLMDSPNNQLPIYAERSVHLINKKNKTQFIEVLESRLDFIEKESKRKRIEKVIRRFVDS